MIHILWCLSTQVWHVLQRRLSFNIQKAIDTKWLLRYGMSNNAAFRQLCIRNFTGRFWRTNVRHILCARLSLNIIYNIFSSFDCVPGHITLDDKTYPCDILCRPSAAWFLFFGCWFFRRSESIDAFLHQL